MNVRNSLIVDISLQTHRNIKRNTEFIVLQNDNINNIKYPNIVIEEESDAD